MDGKLMVGEKIGRAGPPGSERKWEAFGAFMQKAESDPELNDDIEPEEELPETAAEPEDKGEPAEVEEGASPEGDEPADGEEGTETPSETEAATPQVVKFRVRGADRSLDLGNPDEAKELQNLLSKGANYEALVAEQDAKVGERAEERKGEYFRSEGIVQKNQNGEWVPSAQGMAKWALKHIPVDDLRKALNEVAPPADKGSELDLSWAEELERDANPEDPADKALLKLTATVKALAARNSELEQRFQPAQKVASEFEAMRQQALQHQMKASVENTEKALRAWMDGEINKIPVIKDADDYDRRSIWLAADAKARASNEPGSEAKAHRCIAEAIKEFKDRKAAKVVARKTTEKELRTGTRPAARTPAPSAGTPAAPPAKKGAPPKRGTPEFDAWWKTKFNEMVVAPGRD